MKHDEPMSPTCGHRCPMPDGSCFPSPCRRYAEEQAHRATTAGRLEAATWRVQQCRETVREGEKELQKRRAALEQAEIALREIKGEGA